MRRFVLVLLAISALRVLASSGPLTCLMAPDRRMENTFSDVLVSCVINDINLIPDSVTLLRVDGFHGAGVSLAKLGGQGNVGDGIRGLRLVTTRVRMNEQTPD